MSTKGAKSLMVQPESIKKSKIHSILYCFSLLVGTGASFKRATVHIKYIQLFRRFRNQDKNK